MRYNPAWASHLPMLIKVLNNSEGPVLELGMGPFSSPVMHWLCLDKKRPLTSYENTREYFKQNKSFETDLHKVIFLDDWDTADIENTHWGVVFIDQHPAARRKIDARRVANKADYVIIHDTQPQDDFEYEFIKEAFPLFKYRYDYKRQKPYTTVLSNFKDLKSL